MEVNKPLLEKVHSELHLPVRDHGRNVRYDVFKGEDLSLEEEQLRRSILVTTTDALYNWARRSALWPAAFGLACCAIEMMVAGAAKFDISRFGAEVFRPSPRQADVMIVAGTVTTKMAPMVKRIYEQMMEPKYAIAMGVCAWTGGTYYNSYSVIPGVDTIIPVDVYVPGCPPRPDTLLYALIKLQEKIDRQSIVTNPWYQKDDKPA